MQYSKLYQGWNKATNPYKFQRIYWYNFTENSPIIIKFKEDKEKKRKD